MKHPKPRPKKKPAKVYCKVHPAWSFMKTSKGMQRTCTECGFSVTETTDRAPSGGGKVVKSREGDIVV